MLYRLSSAAAAIVAAGLASPAAAQQAQGTEDIAGADEAAGRMVAEVYVVDTVYKTPAEVVTMLSARGYTDLHDFDVEWGTYEVEGTTPAGTDVELEIDPLTGAIMDVDSDWF